MSCWVQKRAVGKRERFPLMQGRIAIRRFAQRNVWSLARRHMGAGVLLPMCHKDYLRKAENRGVDCREETRDSCGIYLRGVVHLWKIFTLLQRIDIFD